MAKRVKLDADGIREEEEQDPADFTTDIEPVSPIQVPSAADPATYGDDTITMLFPKDTSFLEGGIMHKFKAGIQKVPRKLKDHHYLKACGVVET